MKILIAEDEKDLALTLERNFSENGLETDLAFDGDSAIQKVERGNYDILLLDWRMPGKSGFEICKEVRSNNSEIGIILLTALQDISNKISALEYGADDYITKPFEFDEVLARVKAVLRRSNTSNILSFKDYILDLVDHCLCKTEEKLKLPEKEFELLRYMVENKNTILSKEQLAKDVWQLDFYPTTNYIEVTVKNLRKRLEEFTNHKFIKNIYGEGYIFVDED